MGRPAMVNKVIPRLKTRSAWGNRFFAISTRKFKGVLTLTVDNLEISSFGNTSVQPARVVAGTPQTWGGLLVHESLVSRGVTAHLT